MAIFDIFKKSKPEVKEIKTGKTGVADELIEYIASLVADKGSIKEQIKEINKIGKLSAEERKSAYLPVYLSLEKVILAKKPTLTKKYFSRNVLRKQKEFTKEGLRRSIREKFEVSKLSDDFIVLFLDEPQQSLVLYEIMLQKFMDLTPSKSKKKVLGIISKEKNLLKGIKIKKGKLDFSLLNKKLEEKEPTIEEIITPFKKLFSVIYDGVIESGGKELADKLKTDVYNFAETYGYPLNSDALQILPAMQTKEVTSAVARNIIDYVISLISRDDLIKTQTEKIFDAEELPIEERENAYFSVYLELEKFMSEHKPPAIEKELTREELRREIRGKINVQNLKHKFKLLFLEEEEQIIELFVVLYELFFKQIISFWKISDLQKFINENLKGTMSDILEVVVDKETIYFNILGTKLSKLSKSKLKKVIHELSAFFPTLDKKAKELVDEKKVEKAIKNAYGLIKEYYGKLPIFDDFVRVLPEGVLGHERTTSLSPKAAEEVVVYLTGILKKEEIGEHLKAIEETKKLPLEEQSEAFFNIYLNLQHYIIEQRPSFKGKEITLSDLKEKIRKHVNVEDLKDKFQLLFLREDEVLAKLVGDLVKECAANFIDKKALVEAGKELIKKNRLLRNTEITEEGLINFEQLFVNLKKVKADKAKTLNSTLTKVVLAIYGKAKGILGELQAKKLFQTAYTNLQKKYGANLLLVLKVIPKGVLESEKFELLGKEEMEKTAKEMAKMDTLKGEFMNIAAHELKTPLVPIISYLEMLINDKRITRDQREKLEICLSSAKRETDLVSDILDISKLEAGSLKFEFETIDIIELLKEVTDGLGPAVKQKKLTFKVDMPSKLPLVNGDRRRITQVVSNLINNATKFTEKGGITVRAQKEDQDILVGVADTGMGISKENTRKLFTKFFQADTTARRKQGGTGLGLAICKGIVQGHKGKIWVESTLGKGTTFLFTVPFLQGKSETGKGKPEAEKEETEKKEEISEKEEVKVEKKSSKKKTKVKKAKRKK